jgi:hypothetical protein
MNLKKLITKFLPHSFLLLVCSVIFWKYLLFKEYLIFGDLRYITYPLRILHYESLKSGSLPLWSPYIQMGFPLLAEGQIGTFYPFNLLLSLTLSPQKANNIGIILHIYLSGIFVYIYARTISMGQYSSVISALVFMLSGFVISHTQQINILHEIVWLPLAFALLEMLLIQGKSFYGFLLGLVLTIQYLGGQPQISAYTILALSLYLVFNAFLGKKRISLVLPLKRIPILITVFCIGLGVSAIQLLPTLELVQYSVRKVNFSLESAQVGSFSPLYFLNYLFPFFFITVTQEGKVDFWGGSHYLEMFSYVGILPLILSFIAVYRGRDRITTFFSILFMISLLLSLGRYNPLNALIYYISGLHYFRVPARFLYLSTFSLSILAGKSLELLFRLDMESLERVLRNIVKCIIIIIGIIISSLLIAQMLLLATDGLIFKNKYESFLNQALNLKNYHLLIPLLWLIGASFLLAYWKNKGTSRMVKSLIFIFIVTDLSYFSTHFYSIYQWEDAIIYCRYKPKTVDFLKRDRGLYRICSLTNKVILGQELTNEMLLNPNYNMIHHISNIRSLSPLVLQRHQEMENILSEKSYNSNIGFSPLIIRHLGLFSLLNVKYILSTTEVQGKGSKLVFKDGQIRIYQNMRVLPRAFVVFGVKEIEDPIETIKELTSKDFSTGEKYVILEKKVFQHNKYKTVQDTSSLKKEVKIIKYTPREVSILAQLSRNGYLVLSDTYYPGWKAYVNGVPTKILRANYLMRAVALPKGTHRVEFFYTPLSFKLGLGITLISLFLGLITCLIPPLSARRFYKGKGGL